MDTPRAESREGGEGSVGSAGRGRSVASGGAASGGERDAVLAELRAVASGSVSAEPAGSRSRGGGRGGAAQSEDPVQRAKDICLRLLTVRPRTRVELAQALARKEIEDDVAEQVLGRLDEVGLIDDAAFAEVWVRSRHNFRGLSRRALAVELRRKGVADESAADALAAVDAEVEEERARQLVRKRLRALGNADEAAKIRKLVGMLARKGYAEGLAYRVVKDELRTSLLDDTFE